MLPAMRRVVGGGASSVAPCTRTPEHKRRVPTGLDCEMAIYEHYFEVRCIRVFPLSFSFCFAGWLRLPVCLCARRARCACARDAVGERSGLR